MPSSINTKRAAIYEQNRGLAFRRVADQWPAVVKRAERHLGRRVETGPFMHNLPLAVGMAKTFPGSLVKKFSGRNPEHSIIPSPEGIIFQANGKTVEVVPYHPRYGLAFWFLMPTVELSALNNIYFTPEKFYAAKENGLQGVTLFDTVTDDVVVI